MLRSKGGAGIKWGGKKGDACVPGRESPCKDPVVGPYSGRKMALSKPPLTIATSVSLVLENDKHQGIFLALGQVFS